jgi:CheY-like chemotaxis protein
MTEEKVELEYDASEIETTPEDALPIVLLADDNDQVRELLKKFFKKANERSDLSCQVIEAPDGEAAISALDSVHPQVILCDISMPKKDGFEVLEHYNTYSKDSNPFCFFCFLSASPEEKKRAFQEGAMGFLSKQEIDYYRVTLQIRTWLRLAELERQAG